MTRFHNHPNSRWGSALLLPLVTFSSLAFSMSACSSGNVAEPDAAPPVATLEIEYVAHACFRLHAEDGTVLMIDPFASRVWLGYDFPEAPLSTENVLITHPHYDHDYGEFIGNPVPWLETQVVLRDPVEQDIGPFHVSGVVGKHADPWGTEFGQKNTIWIVEAAGLRIAHLGDNGPLSDEAAAEIGQVDILMTPIDGNEHILKYAELQTIIEQLQPRLVVPMHYRLPDLETSANKPEDLGEVDPWLDTQADVQRVGGNRFSLSTATLPEAQTALVFEHGL